MFGAVLLALVHYVPSVAVYLVHLLSGVVRKRETYDEWRLRLNGDHPPDPNISSNGGEEPQTRKGGEELASEEKDVDESFLRSAPQHKSSRRPSVPRGRSVAELLAPISPPPFTDVIDSSKFSEHRTVAALSVLVGAGHLFSPFLLSICYSRSSLKDNQH